MKLNYTLVLTFLLFLTCMSSLPTYGQSAGEVLGKVSSCLRSGNPECLTPYFGERIEIALTPGGTNGRYAPGQARFVIRDFLKHYPPSSFNIVHQSMRAGATYVIGDYRSGNRKFNVSIFMKNVNGKFIIDKMLFDLKS